MLRQYGMIMLKAPAQQQDHYGHSHNSCSRDSRRTRSPSANRCRRQDKMALRARLGAFTGGVSIGSALSFYFLHDDVYRAGRAVAASVDALDKEVRCVFEGAAASFRDSGAVLGCFRLT